MLSFFIFLSAALLIWAAVASIAFYVVHQHSKEALAELEKTEGWVHHNLRAIRAGTEYAFPEAVSVCNSLATAFPLRTRVDLKQLDQHLAALRREHNSRLLESAGQWRAPSDLAGRLRFLVAAHFGLPESAIEIEISDGLVRVIVVKP